MASDAAMGAMDSTNPCCAPWKKNYLKTEAKRQALRQGVDILKAQIDRLQQENLNLKKACDEEKTRASVNEEEKGKEASLRISLEKEIASLKSEISSSQHDVVSGNEDLDKEVTLLRSFLSEKQLEIDRLKQLLTEEGERVDAEKHHVDVEKKKAAELREALAYEKSRADEARKMAAALENEFAALKTEISCEKSRADEARKMADAMEKEISALKSEKSSSDPAVVSGNEDLNNKVTLLQACISERELEIDRLKQLLTKEERKASAERQHADYERKITVELQEALANEKSKADEASRMAHALRNEIEENRVKMESLRNEFDKTKLESEEAKKKLEAEKQKVIEEKRRADEEKTRVIEQRNIAEANEKKVVEQKAHANNLLMQLEEKQENVKKLQKELQEVVSSQRSVYTSELDKAKKNLEAEMKKYAKEKKRADDETCKREEERKVAEAGTKKAVEEKHRADRLSQELKSSRQRVEHLEKQLNEVNNLLENERKKASWEEKRADAEKLKSNERERIAAENRKIATEAKFQADNLCQELEKSRKKLQDMENELHELKSHGKLDGASNVPLVVNEQTSELLFLRKQLKFERQRVKHAKEVAELEKDRKSILQQEVFRVRQGVECLLHQLELLTDISARSGMNNVSKKLGLSDVHSGLLSKRMLPSHMYLWGDEFRMSSLSSRDASCLVKENEGVVPAGHHMESPSASFSDEQLLGSQERVVGSLSASAVLAAEKSNLDATILKCSSEGPKWKDGEKVGFPENSLRNPVGTTLHATKRRKIFDELETIKSMQSEGKRIFEETEKKLSALHRTLVQPLQTDKEDCQLPLCVVNSCSNHDQSSKKRKASHEPEATCLPIDGSTVQAEVRKHEVALTASKRPENSLELQSACADIVISNPDGTSFEELMNGDYMKLLNLDSAVDEECFRTAMERPLSPTLPEIDLCDSETRVDAQMLNVYASNSHEPGDQHGGLMHKKNQLYCIVFSDMEDNSAVNRIFHAIRTCLARCCLFLDTKWLVYDVLAALGLEKDLRPREKACALFSLILLNYSGVSSRKLEDFRNNELLDSFRAHVHSVLSCKETRSLFAGICRISDLLSLFEDFVIHRRIMLQSDAASESRHDSSPSFEILHEGKNYVLSPNVASIDMVVAGSIILASICSAIGQTGSICEVSFNIVRMCGTEDQMMLRILHMFGYICGQEYLCSNSYTFMKIVKSVITFVEHNLASIAGMALPSESGGQACFVLCARCPFSEGSFSLDDISAMLLEELRNHCLGPSVPEVAGQAYLSTKESIFCNLGDVLLSVELIASMMGGNWSCNKIVPKLLDMLESCDWGRCSSTALVALLGELARLRVKEGGYDNVVENIKRKLLGILCKVDTLKCNAFGVAVLSALVGLHPKGHEEFVNNNVELPSRSGGHSASATSEIMRNCISSLTSEQLTSLFGLENHPLLV